jgi:hypothetical protein
MKQIIYYELKSGAGTSASKYFGDNLGEADITALLNEAIDRGGKLLPEE